jgi:cytochrome c oxidase assembly factor 1
MPSPLVADVIANRFRWWRTMPIFLAIIACASLAMFNYQKLSSPVVSSSLYALRTSRKAREYLGDEVYFRHQIPWIRGEMNQWHGRIDIWFTVKGTRDWGTMRFSSARVGGPRGIFETTEWSLTTRDGRVIDLLEGRDPLRGIRVEGGYDVDDEEEEQAATRGFRQMIKK